MPKIQVLLDEKGAVLGTAEVARHRAGEGAPTAHLAPRADQALVEVSISDAEARLDAASLLKALTSKKLR